MTKRFPSSGESRYLDNLNHLGWSEAIFDGFCYRDEKKEMTIDSLVSLAKADGERKWKRSVKVVDFIWSEVCKCWVVVIAIEFPTEEKLC